MRELATAHGQVSLNDRPFAFVASAQEMAQLDQHFDGGFIVWADTENILTSSAPANLLSSGVVALSTAFTIIKQTPGDNDFTARDLVIDECEKLAWQFLHQIERDSEPGNTDAEGNARCTPIAFLETSTITVERDGPYFMEHYGVTARFVIHIKNAIPAHNPTAWKFIN